MDHNESHDQKMTPTTADHCLFIAPMVWTTRTHDQKMQIIATQWYGPHEHMTRRSPQPQIIAYLLHQWYGPHEHMTRRSPQPQIIAYLLHQWYGPHEHMTRRSHNRRSLPIYCTNGMDHTQLIAYDQKMTPTTADHCLFIAPMVWTTRTHDQKIPQPQIIAYLLHQWYGPHEHMTRRSPQPQIIAYLLHQWYGPHEHMTRRSHNRRSLPIYCTNGMDHTNT